MEWDWNLCHDIRAYSPFHSPKSYRKLFHLFCHWCGQRCFHFTNRDMVSFRSFLENSEREGLNYFFRSGYHSIGKTHSETWWLFVLNGCTVFTSYSLQDAFRFSRLNDKKSRKHMYEKLSKFIHLHAKAKQLSDLRFQFIQQQLINVCFWIAFFLRMFVAFSDLYEIILTIVFLGCMLTICVGMLLIQIEVVEYFTIRHFYFTSK